MLSLCAELIFCVYSRLKYAHVQILDYIFDGVSLLLWTAATNGYIVHPTDNIWDGERRWNDIDRGKPKHSEKNLSQSHFGHHKSSMDWPGREPGTPRWEVGD
jgi:hypothetical protein